MCCVSYLVQVYANSNMSRLVKESFMNIWILTSTMIENNYIKDTSPDRAYCKEVNLCKVPSQLYLRHDIERIFVTHVHINK